MSEISNKLDKAEAVINTANLDQETPTYIKALLNCFSLIIGELRDINKSFNLRSEKILSDLSIQKNITDHLKKDNERLSKKIYDLAFHVDTIEQHGRNMGTFLDYPHHHCLKSR